MPVLGRWLCVMVAGVARWFFPGVASRGFAPPCAARNCFREVRRGRRGCARLLPP